MIVYHGTTLEIREPKILRSEIGRDFGFAFYTTDIKEQAERWAVRRAKMEERKLRKICNAIVNVYEWASDSELSILQMEGAAMEWLNMVVNCRSNLNYNHNYDEIYRQL